MGRGGRPTHDYWARGKFKQLRGPDGSIVGAQCLNPKCEQQSRNTAVKRLKSHR